MLIVTQGFPGASTVKNLPANGEDLGLIPESRDPLQREMTIHSNILAWETPWTEGPGCWGIFTDRLSSLCVVS